MYLGDGMLTLARIVACVLLAAVQLACVKSVTGRQFLDLSLSQKAAFDLRCPKEQISFTDLSQPTPTWNRMYGGSAYNVDELATHQGATGCGRQISYVLTDEGWVGDVASSGQAPLPSDSTQQH